MILNLKNNIIWIIGINWQFYNVIMSLRLYNLVIVARLYTVF